MQCVARAAFGQNELDVSYEKNPEGIVPRVRQDKLAFTCCWLAYNCSHYSFTLTRDGRRDESKLSTSIG